MSSFGGLFHFNRDNKPALRRRDAATAARWKRSVRIRPCVCTASRRCGANTSAWIASVSRRDSFVRTSDYGRCVYDSDNDVVDHQVVNFEFAGGRHGHVYHDRICARVDARFAFMERAGISAPRWMSDKLRFNPFGARHRATPDHPARGGRRTRRRR